MFTAKKARNASKVAVVEVDQERVAEEKEFIEMRIKSAIRRGERSCIVEGLSDTAIKWLKSLNYSVKMMDICVNAYVYVICW